MVVIFFPAASPTIMEQERAAWPSIWTVQAPHMACPQPNLVPVRFRRSRIAHSSGICGLTSSSWLSPLMLSVIIDSSCELLRASHAACDPDFGDADKFIVRDRRD